MQLKVKAPQNGALKNKLKARELRSKAPAQHDYSLDQQDNSLWNDCYSLSNGLTALRHGNHSI